MNKKPSVRVGKSSTSTKSAVKKPKTKKADADTTPKSPIEAFEKKMASSQKFKGRVQVTRASNFSTPYFLRRPTGVMGLDIALGGGFHAGGGDQVYGIGSSGKTYLTFKTAGQVQKHYGNDACVIVACAETRLDKGFARHAGFCVAYEDEEIAQFDTQRQVMGWPAFTPEEVADLKLQPGYVGIIRGANGADLLEGTIELMRDVGNSCQLLIIDSLGALLTPDQDKKEVGDRTYGGSSGIITTWQNKIYPLFMMDGAAGVKLELTVLGINQARAVIDGGPRGPKTRPAAGAFSWTHAQLASVELKIGETLYSDASKTVKNGHEIKWEIRKGKAGTRDGFKSTYNWYHIPKEDPVFWSNVLAHGIEYGIDAVTELVETSKNLGVLRTGGPWLVFSEAGQDVHKIQKGEEFDSVWEKIAHQIANDPDLDARIRMECLRQANLVVRYR